MLDAAILTALVTLIIALWINHLKHVRSDEHQSKAEREAIGKAIQAQIEAHTALDNQRFLTIEAMLKEMRDDIKALLTQKTRTRR
jgi:hypothetical protein